jgi:hypothetical protein
MKLAGQMQSNLIDKPWQVHPPTHCFPRTAGINNLAHG